MKDKNPRLNFKNYDFEEKNKACKKRWKRSG